MIVTILVILTVMLFGVSIFLFYLFKKVRNKLCDANKQLAQIDNIKVIQNNLEHILNTGIATFLYTSLNTALNRLDIMKKNLDESEMLNDELAKWIADYGKLTGNVYKQLQSVDDRGIFEKDDEVGFLFRDMLNIITEYNKRINFNDADHITATDEKQE